MWLQGRSALMTRDSSVTTVISMQRCRPTFAGPACLGPSGSMVDQVDTLLAGTVETRGGDNRRPDRSTCVAHDKPRRHTVDRPTFLFSSAQATMPARNRTGRPTSLFQGCEPPSLITPPKSLIEGRFVCVGLNREFFKRFFGGGLGKWRSFRSIGRGRRSWIFGFPLFEMRPNPDRRWSGRGYAA